VTLKVLPTINVEGKTRHEVACEASALMSSAMGVTDPMKDYPDNVHHHCDAVGTLEKA